ncbi:NAD(P)/FAD-dependent oxidoreductase [Thermogemmatispora sp.]|uniref:NAD(P)/FAD-dependent oxidoreductase n=2 Tax=Thermogemmatispora sp. TaxID=1968838 RepID=UPI002ACC1BF9|nr:NAD(P)/FAD-dependent oxidoreductase [Thermogemmatispora sp.]
MQESRDVVVVGGGPAGLAAAEAVASQGVGVLVLERQSEIGYPIHTSGGSWMKEMQELGVPAQLLHPIPQVFFLSPRQEVALRYDPPVACVLDVRGLYQHLAARAIAAGAELRLRHAVDQVLLEEGRVSGVTVRDARGRRLTIRSRVTIDASGMARHIAVRAGLAGAFRRYGYGAEYDLYAPHYPQEELYLLMGSKVAPSGYAWVFPRGQGRVRVGVGVIHPDSDDDARAYLDYLLHEEPRLRHKFRGASPLEYHTGLFPAEGPAERFSSAGLLLAGDAGGQGSTLVGEGIRFAIYAGRLAGQVAAEAVRQGDVSATFLERFDRRWRARFGREMELAYLINRHIAAYRDEQWDEALILLRRLTPAQWAQAMRGEFTPGLLMGIMTRSPRLVASGGRRLIERLLERLSQGAGAKPTDGR